DGATGPLVFGGRCDGAAGTDAGASAPAAERAERLAGRVAKLVALRRAEREERRVAVVLFNFPPNAGNTGTAAYLAVFDSLHRTLGAMARAGYTVDVPATVDELRDRLLVGNAARYGAVANVGATVRADDHVRREPHLAEIEAAWGAAPGRQQSFGGDILVLGARFGNVFVGVQPAFGYEGDPMRLLFERGFAPTHAFSAFYRWIAEDFGAHAVLHFGTHGALEFMPGKQVGLTSRCWPDRLIGDLPNVYLYASNNPSEGALAKRRGAATLVSYLTPPVTNAGLYRGLLELRETLDRLAALPPEAGAEARYELLADVQRQAAALELTPATPSWNGDGMERAAAVRDRLLELEYTLIPAGLHTVGVPPDARERADALAAIALCPSAELELPGLAELLGGVDVDDARARAHRGVTELVATRDVSRAVAALGAGAAPAAARWLEHLARLDALLREDHELPGILRALDGRYVPPAPGGDVLRNAAVLPTGRNVYGFDPYRVPSAHALRDGRTQCERLLRRHAADHGALPETVAVVLWGTDNMKSQGGPLAQVLALLGAEPRFDGLGRLAGARLVPLDELGRPRVDVVVTLSGIFRDLFPLQVRLIAEAALLAAEADEPLELNPVRRHALANQAALGCDLETAALRVFSNAEGAYGANVNLLVDSGRWTSDDALAETFVRRKSFAYGRRTSGVAAPELFGRMLAIADLAYQNLDAVESGATDIDQYVDSLGGLSRAVGRARGSDAPVYFSDNTGASAAVRTAAEQIALESHTRLLNPKWYEAVLKSGYEGARTISAQVTHTLGWSATTGAVPGWVYREACATFVLDPAMRDRLAALNGNAAVQLSERLLEASDRGYWRPSEEMLAALRDANAELEDRLEGVSAGT
ncbi:MAG: Protoporphyrin IX Mg-chelatase subunit H, partial [uncultured Gemmatimonadaceae bacterium]